MAENTLKARLIHAADTAANWSAKTSALKKGEIGIEEGSRAVGQSTQTIYQKFKVGNGTDTWDNLPYANVTPEELSTSITNAINALDVSDSAVTNQYVTKVSEADGKISVTRKQIAFSELSGRPTVNDAAVTNQYVTEVKQSNGTVAITRKQIAFSELSGRPTVNDAAVTNKYVTEVKQSDGTIAVQRKQIAYSELSGTPDLSVYATKTELASAMVFKGTIGQTGGSGTVAAIPTTGLTTGDTYKIIEEDKTISATASATGAQETAKKGDVIVLNTNSKWVIIPSGDEPSGTVTSVLVAAGNGISVDRTTAISESGTFTVSHADTSSQASITANGRKYITAVTLDDYGHVTGLSTGTETVTDTHKPAFKTITPGSASTAVTNITANTTGVVAGAAEATVTVAPGNKWVSVAGDNTNKKLTVAHVIRSSTTGAANTSYGSTAAATVTTAGFKVPYFKFDEAGHVTDAGECTLTLPANAFKDTNTDTLVKMNVNTSNGAYPLLMANGTSLTTGTAYEASYNTGITVNPSTKTIVATTFSGNATSATTATTADKAKAFCNASGTLTAVGADGTPIYINASGVPTVVTYVSTSKLAVPTGDTLVLDGNF